MIHVPKRKALLPPDECMRAFHRGGLGGGLNIDDNSIPGSWDPLIDLGSLTGLFLSDEGIGLNGTDVASWTGVEPAANVFAITPGNQPPYHAGADPATGKPYLQFSFPYCLFGPAASTFVAAATYTWWLVVRTTAITYTSLPAYSLDGMIYSGGYLGTTIGTITGENKAYAFHYNAGEASVANPASGSLGINVWHCYRQRYSGGNLYLSIDGGAETSVAAPNPTDLVSAMWMGRAASAHSMTGDLAAWAVCNASVTGADQTHMDDWMSNYFGGAW